jgi:hypothetical protein
MRDVDQEVSETIRALRNDLAAGMASAERVDLVRAVEMLKRCECRSKKDRQELLKCAVTILSLL